MIWIFLGASPGLNISGDARAQSLWQTLSNGKTQAQQSLSKLDHIMLSLLQDELKVSIHPLEIEQFTRQSSQLKTDVQHLE
ncbi:hypothetical protein CWC08_18820, partial [Pseudoalteromonas ruthenica]